MNDYTILRGDALAMLRTLPSGSVQCVVTSPPYYGLRDYGVPGQIGLEPTVDAYVARLVEVFEECRRVLRDDGTLWLNLGDSYFGGKGSNGNSKARRTADERGYAQSDGTVQMDTRPLDMPQDGLKPKDLIGIPWRVAFALQAAGWWLRSDIIWAKPNPMPESVTDRPTKAHEYLFLLTKARRYFYDAVAIAEPARAWDGQAAGFERSGPVSEHVLPGQAAAQHRPGRKVRSPAGWKTGPGNHGTIHEDGREQKVVYFEAVLSQQRNARSVWNIATHPYPEAHFATFPTEIPRRAILAGTSERGCCPACGAPWVRVVERITTAPESWHGSKFDDGKNLEIHPTVQRREDATTSSQYAEGTTAKRLALLRQQARENGGEYVSSARTTGWRPTCACPPAGPIPCTVLDPFGGSGTTAAVAVGLGRHATLIELNASYIELAHKRIAGTQPPLLSAS